MTIDEGYTKFHCDWSKCELPEFDEVKELRAWRNRLYAAGLIGIYANLGIGFGNISARVGNGREFLISGTQTGHLPDIGPQHFALVTSTAVERNHVSCCGAVQASSESLTHAALYDTDDSIGAVVHVHSAELWHRYRGRIPTTAADVAYGTPQMAAEFTRLWRESDLADSGIAVMGGHEEGLISVGTAVKVAASRILSLQKKRS